MTHYRYFLILGLTLSMLGCGGSDDDPVVPPVTPDKPDVPSTSQTVTFTTDVFTRSVVTQLGESAEMNVYAKEYNTLGSENFVSGVLKSVNKNGIWNITPKVELKKDQKVFLYAVYPYAATNTDPEAIPVDANQQLDYLYSGKGVMASYASPKVQLTLSHALSVMAFNVCKSNYSGNGTLQNLKIQGKDFPTTGVLNVEKGIISGQKPGVLEVKCNQQIKEEGWSEDLPQTFTLPAESNGKNISLSLTIDGKEYVLALPIINIESGNKYIFRLGLTDRGLTLFEDATETISLKQESDKMPIEGGVSTLQFTYEGKSLVVPVITGKLLTPGIIDWGDKSATGNYYVGLSHTFLDGKTHDVSIENWNAEEVTFSNLKGITAVDFTKF